MKISMDLWTYETEIVTHGLMKIWSNINHSKVLNY